MGFHASPNVHIFLASIIAMPSSCHFYSNPHNLTAQEEAYNEEIPRIAERFGRSKVTFVDMKKETGLCAMSQQDYGCCPPKLHPNGVGYAKMAAVWAKALLHHMHNMSLEVLP